MSATRMLARLCLLALAAPMMALAQGLPDPTKPPLDHEMPAGAEGMPAAAGGLQAIVRRQGAKPGAMINGEYVELGGRLGDARLVKVTEDAVVLQGPAGKEELRLLPGVDKKLRAPAVAAKAKKRAPAQKKDEANK